MLNYSGARVLITGNTGFCGVWLSSLLHILGAKVYGFSRDSSNFSTLFGPEEIEQKWPTVKGRVEDKIHFQNSVASIAPDLIFHLAAQSLVGRGYKSPFETFESNFNGTLSVLESSLTAPSLKGLVVITTDKVYADSSKLNTENSTLGGIDPYSCSKVAAEYAVTAYRPIFSNKNISLAVVRGGNVIGGGDWSEDRLVPDIVKT
jgi:CDP-glucose 4,6-dehydratase